MHARAKCRALIISLGLCGLLLWPIVENFKEEPVDNFPLSYYPMFTTIREPTYPVSHPVGLDQNKRLFNLPYTLAGRGGFNQTRRQISKSVREGKAQALCDQIASVVPQLGLDGETRILSVAIVTTLYDLEAYYTGERKVLKRYVHAISKVPYQQP